MGVWFLEGFHDRRLGSVVFPSCTYMTFLVLGVQLLSHFLYRRRRNDPAFTLDMSFKSSEWLGCILFTRSRPYQGP